MSRSTFLARRLAFLVAFMLGATLVTFVVANLVPGDPVAVNLGDSAMSDAALVRAFREKYGLDKPLPVQYYNYLRNLVVGDFGRSIRTGRPVGSELARFFPATIELATVATIFSVTLGVVFGVVSAARLSPWLNNLVRSIAVMGVSVPNFWLGLVALYIFYFQLGWFPGPGRLDAYSTIPEGTGFLLYDTLRLGRLDLWRNAAHHLLLPALVLGAFTTGLVTRTTRSSLLEALAQDYVRTAAAKGLARRTVVVRHALPNALIPVVTIIGLSYGNLLGGTVLVETIFAWPGMGRYAFQAATTLDFPPIMGVALIITMIYVVINTIVDVAYGFLDPRIRYT